MQFHEKLYTLRKAANMTQNDLAEKLNVSRQAVSRWEMGTAKPEVDTLIAMSDLFGVTLDDLLKNKETIPQDYVEPPSTGPSFWEFLPKKWWIWPVAAIGCKLSSYVFIAVLMGLISAQIIPGESLISNIAWMPLLNFLYGVFLAVTAACFIWALVRWLKARK